METKQYYEDAWVKDNLSVLKQFKSAAGQLAEIWARVNKNTPITTAHYQNWLKDPEYIYQVYKKSQIGTGFPEEMFDKMPEEARRPPMFEKRDPNPVNPLGVTRIKADGSNVQPTRSGASQRPGKSFDFIYSRAKVPSHNTRRMARERGSTIVVTPEWITFSKGYPVVKDAEKRITELVSIELTPEMQQKAAQMEAALEMFSGTNPKDLPLKKDGLKGKYKVDLKRIASEH